MRKLTLIQKLPIKDENGHGRAAITVDGPVISSSR